MNEDITFCTETKCPNASCQRHAQNIRHMEVPISFADLRNSEYCPREKEQSAAREGAEKR